MSDTVASQSASQAVALADGRGGIVGVKAGMTQVYNEDGNQFAVTVIDVSHANVITQVKTPGKDGYAALQISLLPKSKKNTIKAELGHLKKSGLETGQYISKEFRLPADTKLDGYAVGGTLSPDFIKDGDIVCLTAVSKGKGFQGVMKRWHFRGGKRSHGTSVAHRMPGSINNVGRSPSRVGKGKKMAGQMGNYKTTVENVRVIRVDAKNGVILVNGSVPGPRSGVVTIQKAVKVKSKSESKAAE